ncbi:MAG: hypothetical protein NTW60_03400 [Candidatus Wolfebacteria bacterium]|nr:hypothetical protein [Candidatus Wolfebacteria bacterium]
MEVTEMRGDIVIVRSYGGVPLVRRIWEEDERGVYITDDVQLKRLLAGGYAIPPIGFHREDVFRFNPEIATDMDDLNSWDWNKLTPV